MFVRESPSLVMIAISKVLTPDKFSSKKIKSFFMGEVLEKLLKIKLFVLIRKIPKIEKINIIIVIIIMLRNWGSTLIIIIYTLEPITTEHGHLGIRFGTPELMALALVYMLICSTVNTDHTTTLRATLTDTTTILTQQVLGISTFLREVRQASS